MRSHLRTAALARPPGSTFSLSLRSCRAVHQRMLEGRKGRSSTPAFLRPSLAPEDSRSLAYFVISEHSSFDNSSSTTNIARMASDARVLISNPEFFATKKNSILRGGLRKLQIITDFDKTLTPLQKADGKPAPTSYSILESSGTFSKRYHSLAEELYARVGSELQAALETQFFLKYHPSEVSLSMPMHQKKEEMVTWWTLANANLIEEHIRFTRIAEQVAASGCVLRQGTQALMALLAAHNGEVPTLVFSAGIGDVLAEVLKHEGVPETPNLRMHFRKDVLTLVDYISNFVDVDREGFVVGFKPPLIHVFNKNETSLAGTPYFRQVAERPNVILMGDSLGDVGMSAGVPHEVVLKVGFLNELHGDAHRLHEYQKVFDVVICDDGPMDWVELLVREALAAEAAIHT